VGSCTIQEDTIMRKSDLGSLAVACAAALALAGCADTRAERTEAEKTADEAGEKAERAAEKAGDAVEKAAEKAGDALKDAGEKAEPAVEEGAQKLDAARQTVEIKAALMADAGVDASRIDVDTDATAKTVTLKGTVPTTAQKATAERIARGKANGYAVKNLLVVG
jgi:osmotically-inducible protein OsmY